MKNLWITALAVTVTTSCSNEDDFLTDNLQHETNRVVLSATISDGQGGTRSVFNIDEDSKTASFLWKTGDAITVFSTGAANQKFDLTEGDGQKAAKFAGSEGATIGTLAYYPHNEGHANGTFVLPATYGAAGTEYVEDTHAAYSATIANNTATFSPLAGVLRVKFESVPTGVTQFELTADRNIAGKFTIAEGKISTEGTCTEAVKTVTYAFAALGEAKAMTFYIPLPVGTYSSFQTALKAGEDVVFSKTYSQSQEIQFGKLTAIGSLSSADYTKSTDANGVVTYTVYTAEGLQKVNKILTTLDGLSNKEKKILLQSNISLMNDIDLTNALKDDTGSNWKAIGKYVEQNLNHIPYTGTFNGNNKKIKGLVINSTEDGQGLIGCLGKNGIVRELHLVDCEISSSGGHIGGIAGENTSGTIEECTVTNGSLISTSTSIASCVGGIVGRNYYESTISSCKTYSLALKSDGDMVGGIAGQNFHIIKDSEILNTASDVFSISGKNIIGGIVGNNNAGQGKGKATISNCHVVSTALEKITITGTGYNNGGLIGSSTQGIIENCSVSYCTITGAGNQAGGLLGFNSGSVVSGCVVNNCVVTGNSRVGGIAGKNAFDKNYAESPESTGIILSCFANGVNVVSKLTTEDAETPTEKSSAGGVVGINVSAQTVGNVIGCYALNCTKGEGKDALDNVVGFNAYKTETRYGTVTTCYYKSSDAEETVHLVHGTTDPLTSESTATWSEAISAMNNSIDDATIPDGVTVTKKYWTGELTGNNIFSTTKQE